MFNSLFKLNYENETSNSILLCPICKNELLKIVSISYDDSVNDYIINYNCSLKSNNKTPEKINLKKFIISQNSSSNTSKDFPSYCPYHEFNPAPFFCPECNDNLCKDCYKEHLLYEQDNDHFKKLYEKKKNCKIHKDQKLMNYCQVCDKIICSQCIKDIHFSHHDNWVDLENDFYQKFNININNKIKYLNNFIKSSLINVEEIIDKANNLKKYINECYNNYLDTYLPVVNLYKLFLFKSLFIYSNDLNEMINNFNFDDLYFNINDNYYRNNYLKNKKNLFEDTLSKLNKEIKIIEESLSIYIKGMDFIFKKINFKYIDKSIDNKYIHLDNPFIISKQPKKYSKCIKELTNHKDEIFCLIKLSNGDFATGSADGLVLIWNNFLLDLSLTIHAHKGGVSSLCQAKLKNKDILLSGGNDSIIQLWDINDDYNNIKKIKINGPIINLFYLTNEVFSSFTNNQIILWSFENYENIFKVEINDIFILEYLSDNIFAAGMEDNSIMIFNIFDTKMTYKKTLIGNDDIVSCIKKINQKYIISGNYEGNLMIWDLIKMELFFQIKKAHLYKITSIIHLSSGLFATCSSDKNIKIWDLHKRINVLTFSNAHKNSIRGIIQLNNGILVSAGNDSIIKIWN